MGLSKQGEMLRGTLEDELKKARRLLAKNTPQVDSDAHQYWMGFCDAMAFSLGELKRALAAAPSPEGEPTTGDFDMDGGHTLPNLIAKWKGMERMYATAMDLQMSRASEEGIQRYRAKAEVCRDFLQDLSSLAAAPRDGNEPAAHARDGVREA